MKTALDRLAAGLRHVEVALLAGGILLIALATIGNVLARIVFGVSIAATEELSRFAILFVTFAGLSHGASRGRHIRMTALYDLGSARTRKGLTIFGAAVTGGLCFALAAFGVGYLDTVYTLGTRSPVLSVPLWIGYLAAPVGLALAGLQCVLTIARNATTPGIWLSADTPAGQAAVAEQPGI